MLLIATVAALGIIIILHELGHYWMCRRCGVHVTAFSIGFGRTLYQYHNQHGTLFTIKWIPLGGYITPYGQLNHHEINPKHSYYHQPAFKKILIILAGPLINFLCAFILYGLLFWHGLPGLKPIIYHIEPHTPAAQIRLQPQDKIIKVNNQPITYWRDLLLPILKNYGDKNKLVLTIQRGDNTIIKRLNLNKLPSKPKNNLWKTIGIIPPPPTTSLYIHKIIPHSIAAQAQLQTNDKLIAINDQLIQSWVDFKTLLTQYAGQRVTLKYQRYSAIKTIYITLPLPNRTFGISMKKEWPSNIIIQRQFTFFSAWIQSIKTMAEFLTLMSVCIIKLINGSLSLKLLSGPIGIAQAGIQALTQGFISFLYFIAYINLVIGYFNLLPIPGLDGGHLIFQLIGMISKKPVSEKKQALFTFIGLSLIGLLIIYVTLHDLLHLFS